MNENFKTVEINGIKMEVDLRHAKVIEKYRVGDPVKILIKKYSDYKSYPGVIVGFDEFRKLPTIVVAYLDAEYSGAEIKFSYFNKQTEDVEICPANKLDVPFKKSDIVGKIQDQIAKKEEEIKELKSKAAYFENNFKKYFEDHAETFKTTEVCQEDLPF